MATFGHAATVWEPLLQIKYCQCGCHLWHYVSIGGGVDMTLSMADETRKMLTPLVSGITQTMKDPNCITKQEFDNALYEFILHPIKSE